MYQLYSRHATKIYHHRGRWHRLIAEYELPHFHNELLFVSYTHNYNIVVLHLHENALLALVI
jgi:hypothetical protein